MISFLLYICLSVEPTSQLVVSVSVFNVWPSKVSVTFVPLSDKTAKQLAIIKKK